MNKYLKKNRRETGSCYEKLAGEFLKDHGYRILSYNYRCRFSEIDIVAMDGEYLVFCEVKYRTENTEAHALEAVDLKKQRRISRAALFYLAENKLWDVSCRFDVIGIDGEDICLIKNAFDFVGE